MAIQNYTPKNILFIGCGNMGEPVLKAFLKQGVNPDTIYVEEKTKEQLDDIKKKYKIQKAEDLLEETNLLVFGVKPQQLSKVDLTKFKLAKDVMVISILAGVTMKKLEDKTGIKKIARVMPNLPLIVSTGMSTFITQNISQDEKDFVKKVFSTQGKILELKNEEDMHAVTLLAGSGPGLYYYFCTLFKDLAKEYGFNNKESEELAHETFIGAAKLLEQSKESAEVWQSRVTSKGGTTEVAIRAFKEMNLYFIIKKALEAGIKRSKEMGE